MCLPRKLKSLFIPMIAAARISSVPQVSDVFCEPESQTGNLYTVTCPKRSGFERKRLEFGIAGRLRTGNNLPQPRHSVLGVEAYKNRNRADDFCQRQFQRLS